MAQNNTETKTGKRRKSAIDGRTTRHAGYKISQVRRKATGCIFSWGKQHVTLRKAKVRGIGKLGALFDINLAVYNLARRPGLRAA